MNRRLVAFVGYATCGKDETCKALGYQRAAFADALKSDLAPVLAKLPPHEKWQIRPLLVEYGRTGRRIEPDYWIKRIVIPSDGDVAATDCRYPNEIRFLLDNGFIVIRLHRPGVFAANDEERYSIGEIDAKFHLPAVTNDDTPEVAASRVRDVLRMRMAA